LSKDVQIEMHEPASVHPLLVAPVLPTLLKLAGPNLLGLTTNVAVTVAETAYVGSLGTLALAAVALVFPTIMLMQMMSGGGMGGGVSSAVSQALGSRDQARAEAIARHAAVIALIGGLIYGVVIWTSGPAIFHMLGGRGETLATAALYAHIAFLGAVSVWMMNLMASVHRGAGNMAAPSFTQMAMAVLQIIVGGTLCFGWLGMPRLGLVGVAIGQITASTIGAVVMIRLLYRPNSAVKLRLLGPLNREHFAAILKVGAPASLGPFQTVATIMIITSLVARLGNEALAGYGIGSRLEFMALSVGFSFGIASLPMVGLAIGAGNVPRARQVAWTAGAVSSLTLGALGLLTAIFPDLWASHFTRDPAVLDAARAYLSITGFAFFFFGLGMAMGFSSQGAGKPLGPLVAGTSRLIVVFLVVALGTVTMGTVTAAFVHFTPWERRSQPKLA
jgi:putative MATE family efflux protein